MKSLKSKLIENYVLLICLSILFSLSFSANSFAQVVQEAGTLTSWGSIKIISAKNENIQKETMNLMTTLSDAKLLQLSGTHDFYKTFYAIHGFGLPSVDYDQDIDLDAYAKMKPE